MYFVLLLLLVPGASVVLLLVPVFVPVDVQDQHLLDSPMGSQGQRRRGEDLASQRKNKGPELRTLEGELGVTRSIC